MHELQITFPVGELLWYAVTPRIPNKEGLFYFYFETFCREKLDIISGKMNLFW